MPDLRAQMIDGASPAQTAALAFIDDAHVPCLDAATVAAADAQWWLRAVWLDAFRPTMLPVGLPVGALRASARYHCGF